MKNLLAFALLALAILTNGCATPDPGQDALVIRAEQTAQAAFETFDAFLAWEHANHTTAPAEVKKLADRLRDEAPALLKSARVFTKAYKGNRSPENKATLQTLLATLDTLRSEALRALTPPAASLASPCLAVAPAVVIMAIDGLYRLIALISGLIAQAKRTKEWTPDEEVQIDLKLEEAFKAAHWRKAE